VVRGVVIISARCGEKAGTGGLRHGGAALWTGVAVWGRGPDEGRLGEGLNALASRGGPRVLGREERSALSLLNLCRLET